MVDGPFFDMFRHPAAARRSARPRWREPGNVVLSRSEALRSSAPTNAVGQTLTLIDDDGDTVDHRVTGVFADLPRNSHLRIVDAGPLRPGDLAESRRNSSPASAGRTAGSISQLRARRRRRARSMPRMPAWERRAIPDEGADGARANLGDQQDYRLVNVARRPSRPRPGRRRCRRATTRARSSTFSIVALLILAMACVNFTNLATARASQRAREVALRKVLGASRRQLIVQFLGESTDPRHRLDAARAGPGRAAAAVARRLPRCRPRASTISAPTACCCRCSAWSLLVGAVGGLYPAFYLSRFRPPRCSRRTSRPPSRPAPAGCATLSSSPSSPSRSLSSSAPSVVYAQTLFARQADPGFDRSGLIQVVEPRRRPARQPARRAGRRRCGAIPGVTAAARTGIGVNTPNTITTGITVPGRSRAGRDQLLRGRRRLLPTRWACDLVAGRTFDARPPGRRRDRSIPTGPRRAIRGDRRRAASTSSSTSSPPRRLGFADPRQAVGRQLRASIYDQRRPTA